LSQLEVKQATGLPLLRHSAASHQLVVTFSGLIHTVTVFSVASQTVLNFTIWWRYIYSALRSREVNL